ncbi:MAG: cupin domain-containing protein [Ignavibacteria bacterium]|nr:cupin domain-containing protein [Ignavibacteria bacterium]
MTNELFGNVNNIKEIIQFQPESVVSRTLLKNEGGNVTLFSFWEGQGLSEHTAPFDALIICLEGTAKITIGPNEYLLNEDDSIIMPANIPHSLKALSNFKMLLIMIRKLNHSQ